MARKPREEIQFEFETAHGIVDVGRYHFYSVGSYNEPKSGMEFFIDRIGEGNFKSVNYEQFFLTPIPILERMAVANSRTSITLSPESHDLHISKLSGRGVYTNEELEDWIEKALDIGINNIDIWYFIGMPEQDKQSVDDTIAYCNRLLDKFRGKGVNPMVCPMIPFLDPASTFFEKPQDNGYRVFYRTAEEHRRGMERASIINRINYETKWLSRSDLVNVGFHAVRSLMEAKGQVGMLPSRIVENYIQQIDDALEFIEIVHAVDCIADEKSRLRELDRLGDDIKQRNDMVLFSGVMNQAFPINRSIGGRWFDELGWSEKVLDAACKC
jgi:clorobiocin biosynthesis protein CloN6